MALTLLPDTSGSTSPQSFEVPNNAICKIIPSGKVLVLFEISKFWNSAVKIEC